MRSKKKILYCITKANFGGAQKYVLDLSSHFVSGGHEVLVVHGENEFGGDNTFVNKMDEVDVHHRELSGLKRDIGFINEWKVFFSLISLFRKEKPDIVHLNSSKMGTLGGLAARLARVPRIIYTAHGLPHNEPRSLVQRVLIQWITWVTFILVHQVIVVSDRELKEVESWWGIKGKAKRIYNGIEDGEFTSRALARATLSDRIGIDLENRVVLGSVAELTKNKGLLEFLPVLKKIKEKYPDFVYVHLGTGEQETQLKKLTSELDLEENVFWFGFEATNDYLKGFDIFTLPSLKEGLPYALLDAGSAGIAVAASNVGGIPEIIVHEQTGVTFSPKKQDEAVRTLEMLISDDGMREEYGAALQAHIQRTFSLDSMLSKTKEVYSMASSI